jgi:hypothetical protein
MDVIFLVSACKKRSFVKGKWKMQWRKLVVCGCDGSEAFEAYRAMTTHGRKFQVRPIINRRHHRFPSVNISGVEL